MRTIKEITVQYVCGITKKKKKRPLPSSTASLRQLSVDLIDVFSLPFQKLAQCTQYVLLFAAIGIGDDYFLKLIEAA